MVAKMSLILTPSHSSQSLDDLSHLPLLKNTDVTTGSGTLLGKIKM
jgi:hypothetical protein